MQKRNSAEHFETSYITNTPFFKKITQLPFVSRVILYGSRARGDYRERSDIDLAIDCPQASLADWLTIVDIIEDNQDTLLGIDYVRYDELSDTNQLKKAIDKEGKVIFKRGDKDYGTGS